MAARNQSKAAGALAEVTELHPDASVVIVELDLGDLASVQRSAETIADRYESVDILVNNAGLMAIPEAKTADGFEMQFGVNHLGHYALTALLLPPLLRAEAARVVTVTSTAHHGALRVDPNNPHLEGKYNPWRAYNRSKLANFYFALGLEQQFRSADVSAESLLSHPGMTHTDLQDAAVAGGESGWIGTAGQRMASRLGMSEQVGARTQLRAATDPNAHGGEFYAPQFVTNGQAVRRPILRRVGMQKAIDSLWQLSERETGITLDVAAAAAALGKS